MLKRVLHPTVKVGREIRGQVKPVTRLEAGPIRPYLLSGPTGPGQTQEQNKSKNN